MPNPPTDNPTGVELVPGPIECNLCGGSRPCVRIPVPPGYAVELCRVCVSSTLDTFDMDVDGPHPLIGRKRWEAYRELLQSHGNAFAVGGIGSTATGSRSVGLLGLVFLSRPLSRPEVANLIAWLLMVSGVTAPELEAVCQAQGFPLSSVLALEGPPVCGKCGGELVGDPLACSSCGLQVPK